MSITLKLQYNKSDDHELVKNVSDITSVTAIIKEDTSIIDPVFVVSGGVSTFASCNYATATGLGGRKYFVNNIITKGNGMTELHCHVDVLSSVASSLGDLEAVVERQQEKFNLYLDDGSFKTYANPHIVQKEFTSGFSSPCYILAVAGGQ